MHLLWKTLDPVTAGGGMRLLPTATFTACPRLDLVCVPGGAGMNPLLNDEETLDFVRRQASGARYVTSVCTGSLVLGAAGLLKGRRRPRTGCRCRCSPPSAASRWPSEWSWTAT